MQKLLEDMTPLEATSALLGKPAAVFVLMHSVGGKSVLSRLQGVLSTMGLTIPPMSGMVYSLVTELALKGNTSHAKDFWQIEDAELILENLLRGCEVQVPWEAWPVDRKDARRRWLQI
jgi:chromate reductase